MNDPYAYDNKGFLKQRIIDTRISHLKQEIATFTTNMNIDRAVIELIEKIR